MLYYIGLSLAWLDYFLGVVTCPGIVPTVLTVLWKGQTKTAAIVSQILGMMTGFAVWLGATKALYGVVNVTTSGSQLSCMYGVIASFVSPAIYTVAISLIKPASFDWNKLFEVELITDDLNAEEIEANKRAQMLSPAMIKKMKKMSKFASFAGVAMFVGVWIIWPYAMYGSRYVFSKKFFTGWIVVCIIYAFFTFFLVTFYPLWDGRHQLKIIVLGLLGKKSPTRGIPQEHVHAGQEPMFLEPLDTETKGITATGKDKANRRINNNNNAAANRIRGPQSALTDFLASHNISAQQIHQDYQRRVQEAERQAQHNAQNNNDDKENEDEEDEDDIVERQKRKRKEEKALLKIKQSKEFKRRKHEQDDDFEQDDDELAKSMLAKSKPLPGQLDNCEVCGKRFTVTPYSGTGPDGGLLCTKCSKELKDEKKKEAKAAKKKVAAPRGRRRQTESDRMMGDVKPGAKSLLEICVRHVANVAHDIDEFGDMPQYLLDRLSQIFSKQRVFTPRVLELFLRPDVDRINVYDCGKLEKEDFQKIFAFMPNLESVNLRFAGQLKDDVIMYMADKCKKIRHLQLGATNLVSDNAWIELFRSLGPQLESLKLSELNDSLRDDTIKELVKNCPNLKRLKLRSCSYVTEESLESFCALTQLEHLTLAIAQDTSADTLSKLVSTVGHNLRTLCLEEFSELDDTVLDAIKSSCTRLSKLRIRGSSLCTDGAFAGLFDNNCPFPPLVYADFADNRDIDSMNPDGPEDDPVGFGSLALTALMNHSGPRLKTLDLKSCRHITHAALLEAFDGLKRYPALTDIDLSFVTQVDEVVLVGIFKSCPSLAKLAVFACFNARQAVIPAGIAVIGLPNPQDNIVREGDVQMVMS